jgi:hypothetical protein
MTKLTRSIIEQRLPFETPLWDAGWISEFVYEIASVSLRPSFEIKTPLRCFRIPVYRRKI